LSIDLHVHTTASDGTDSPEQVVLAAKKIGLGAIAITDHDTFAGIQPATEAGQKCGLKVIPGIELSTEYHQLEIHILGYLPDMSDKALVERIAQFRAYRVKRMEKMVAKLRKLGLPVELDRVLEIAGNGAAGRPHLATAMLESGIIDNANAAFTEYIGKKCVAYVPRHQITPKDAILLIRQAHGIPVLAHPGSSNASSLIPELIEAGLVGIEAYHPAHSWELSEYYRKMGENHNLIVTGGSDYHGLERRKGFRLGMYTVPDQVFCKMQEYKEEMIKI